MEICRFAPTTSGRAHPGTLLAFLLAWLDARSRGARFILRMEDIDPSSVTETHRQNLLQDLEWFGLDWDEIHWQSQQKPHHEALLETLAQAGRLYACTCTRSQVQRAGIPSAAGGWVYPGTCRYRRVRDWRSCGENLRCDLSDLAVSLKDESGADLSQTIAGAMGDPVVRRWDGSVTYQLAVVADDQASGVTRVVRGRDIAPSSATQAAFYDLSGHRRPQYRHHLLLLEPQGEKLAKFHQSVGVPQIQLTYSPAQLRGFLAAAAGFWPSQTPGEPQDLLQAFSWEKTAAQDRVVTWDGQNLTWQQPG